MKKLNQLLTRCAWIASGMVVLVTLIGMAAIAPQTLGIALAGLAALFPLSVVVALTSND
jgi:hypothetical protein